VPQRTHQPLYALGLLPGQITFGGIRGRHQQKPFQVGVQFQEGIRQVESAWHLPGN